MYCGGFLLNPDFQNFSIPHNIVTYTVPKEEGRVLSCLQSHVSVFGWDLSSMDVSLLCVSLQDKLKYAPEYCCVVTAPWICPGCLGRLWNFSRRIELTSEGRAHSKVRSHSTVSLNQELKTGTAPHISSSPFTGEPSCFCRSGLTKWELEIVSSSCCPKPFNPHRWQVTSYAGKLLLL